MKKTILITIGSIITVASIWLYFQNKYCKVYWSEVLSTNSTRPVDELKRLVIEKNDKEAYYELYYAYLNSPYYVNEYVFYSLLMANKCHNRKGYYSVFHDLRDVEAELGEDFYDKETKAFMLDYLRKGVSLGDELCYKELGEIYMEGKYLPKDTILGEKLIKKSGFWD